MIRVDLRDFKRLSKDLESISKAALPHAARNALNAMAFEGRKLWQAEMGKAFTLRNDWTTRRLFVDKAKGATLAGMRSTLESPDAFLLKQEAGGVEHHVVPTGVATAEGRGASPRRRLVSKPNKVANIALAKQSRSSKRKQRNAIAIRQAAAKGGQRFVFLVLPKRRGLFKLRGGKRNLELDMVWDASKGQHVVPRSPTLQRSIGRLTPKVPALLTSALIDQLKRHKAFGY